MPQVVLVYPQIPPNTGNVARTCAATETKLHLVGPLGFSLSDRYLKRAGLDYWPYVDLLYHPTLADFKLWHQNQKARWIGFTPSSTQNYLDFKFDSSDLLLFGSETLGLDHEVLELCDHQLYIPMKQSEIRSLNLSVSVAIGLFEALRQLNQLNQPTKI